LVAQGLHQCLERKLTMSDRGSPYAPGPHCQLAPLAAGPLDGLNFAVKDLIDVIGSPTGGGNPDWLTDHPLPAAQSAPAVSALLRAGAALDGKVITDELAFSLEGENAHYGTPLNTLCPARMPGGSSSGSASVVAAGLADFALGTDTGGSVRVPAAFCGLCGMRPTHGRISLQGVIPFAHSYDTIGWFARDAALLEQVGAVLLGEAVHAAPMPELLLAVDVFAMATGAIADAVEAVARGLGAQREIDVFGGRQPDWLKTYEVLQGPEIWAAHGEWITSRQPRFGANIAPRFAGLPAITPAQVAEAQIVRDAARAQLAALLGPKRWLVLPTVPVLPLPLDASGDARGEFYRLTLAMTSIAGHAGLPQITLPLSWEIEGWPVALSLIGPPGADLDLLAYATRVARQTDLLRRW
jgi:amidase